MTSQILLVLLLSSFAVLHRVKGLDQDDFMTTVDPKSLGLGEEKFSHFRVYWHELYAGPNPNPTAMTIVPSPTGNNLTGFGVVGIMDNPLTLGPDMGSKLVGRAQGITAQASLVEEDLLMAVNLVFVEGRYNGSTLTVLGRNQVSAEVRELPIVGGSGLFRFARGYVLVTTYYFNETALSVIAEYNVYVSHYF